MSPNKVLWSVVCGTTSGIIAAWLAFKFLEKKGSGPKGTREEIRELKDEQYDRDNPADKLPEENDERLDKTNLCKTCDVNRVVARLPIDQRQILSLIN